MNEWIKREVKRVHLNLSEESKEETKQQQHLRKITNHKPYIKEQRVQQKQQT